jgi:hypothetical protein
MSKFKNLHSHIEKFNKELLFQADMLEKKIKSLSEQGMDCELEEEELAELENMYACSQGFEERLFIKIR